MGLSFAGAFLNISSMWEWSSSLHFVLVLHRTFWEVVVCWCRVHVQYLYVFLLFLLSRPGALSAASVLSQLCSIGVLQCLLLVPPCMLLA